MHNLGVVELVSMWTLRNSIEQKFDEKKVIATSLGPGSELETIAITTFRHINRYPYFSTPPPAGSARASGAKAVMSRTGTMTTREFIVSCSSGKGAWQRI